MVGCEWSTWPASTRMRRNGPRMGGGAAAMAAAGRSAPWAILQDHRPRDRPAVRDSVTIDWTLRENVRARYA